MLAAFVSVFSLKFEGTGFSHVLYGEGEGKLDSA